MIRHITMGGVHTVNTGCKQWLYVTETKRYGHITDPVMTQTEGHI